jgi:hypothetical protein
VEFRFSGNKMFLLGTQNLTVGEVFQQYMTGDQVMFYMPPDKKSKATKGPALYLEVFIDKLLVRHTLPQHCNS